MDKNKKIRTRFAPSPTGYLHIGNLRTALYTYLIAKQGDGDFILRIEDTDQARLIDGATQVIYDTLKETGLIWDEGPDIGGPVGPYVQSERMELIKSYAEKLIENDKAYYCFCTKERLDELAKIQKAQGINTGYDGHCSHLLKDEVEENLENNIGYVIRQRIPKEGKTTFSDINFGDITVENSELDDQVLIKSDGMPTYNFANVVDDHLMGITHVVRGNEYLSSAPKYNLLYEAFGWEIPEYIHVAHIMKNAKEKLSKRDGDASYQDLIEKGYLTEAIMNYIALLGWAPKGEDEIFSLNELIKEFDVKGISKSSAIFDVKKLNYINGIYINKLSNDEFHDIALPWIRQSVKREDVDTKALSDMLKPRCDVFSDIPDQIDFIDKLPDYLADLYIHKKMKTTFESSLDALNQVLPIIEGIDNSDFNIDTLNNKVKGYIKENDLKMGAIMWPIRTAVSGKQFTPGGGLELAAILGKEDTILRIKKGIEILSK